MGLSRWAVWCLVLLALFFIVEGRLGCKGGVGCLRPEAASPDSSSRKVSGMSKEFFKGVKPLDPGVKGDLVGWDLRLVPSGPDPLHHNGSPRKPRHPYP